jgi:hypothetical protein
MKIIEILKFHGIEISDENYYNFVVSQADVINDKLECYVFVYETKQDHINGKSKSYIISFDMDPANGLIRSHVNENNVIYDYQ